MSAGERTCPSCGALRTGDASCPLCGIVFAEYEAEQKSKEGVPNVQPVVDAHPKTGKSAADVMPDSISDGKKIQFCPVCGNRLSGTPKFCAECGANLESYRAGGSAKQSNKTQNVSIGSSLKPVYVAVIAIVVIGAGIIGGMALFSEKHPAPEKPPQQAAQNPPAARAPTTEQLEAVQNLSSTVAANPNDTASVLALANAYSDIDDYKSAITYFQKYIAANPKNPNALTDYAYALFRNGDTQGAIAQMKQAIAVNPKFQQAYFNLAVVQFNDGNMPEGLVWLKKCIAIDSTSKIAVEAKNLIANHADMFKQQ